MFALKVLHDGLLSISKLLILDQTLNVNRVEVSEQVDSSNVLAYNFQTGYNLAEKYLV